MGELHRKHIEINNIDHIGKWSNNLSEFLKYITTEKLPRGKYFIFISNILSYTKMSRRLWWKRAFSILKELRHGDFKRLISRAELKYITNELQNTVANSKRIGEGSVILAWMGGKLLRTKSKSIVLFKKANHRIEVLDEVPVSTNDN